MSDLFSEDGRGHSRLKTDRDFTDSTWCYTKKGVFSQILNKHFRAYVIDVSKGGLGFISDVKIDEDAQVSVALAYKDYRPFMLCGRVRFCKSFKAKNDKSGREYYKIGIQFQYNDSEVVAEYTRLLKRLNNKLVIEEG